MRRPTRRSRGQGSSRRPTPLPSPPVRGRGGPKGPPVRGVPKTPPKPRPVRGGRRITEPPRPIRGGPKTPPKPPGGRVPKRVKEPLTPIKKTPPNTGTSTKTAKREKLDAVPVKANPNIKLAKAVSTKTPPNTGQPRTLQPAKAQPQVTAAERKQLMEAALRAREAKAPTQQAAAKTAELQKRLFNDAQRAASKNTRPKTKPERGPISVGPAKPFKGTPRQTLRPPAPTGSRAAAMRRRKRSGGLAGALRRARSR